MRARLSLLVVVFVALLAVGPQVLATTITFSFTNPKAIDLAHRAGEPGLLLDGAGRVFVHAPSSLSKGNQGWLWRSVDGGASFQFIENVAGKRVAPEVGGGDSHMAATPGGRLYYADLWLGDISVVRSDDGGLTWTTGTLVASNVPVNDRQWLATYGENVVYLAFNQLPYGPMVSKSVDGGVTWVTLPAVGTSQTTGSIGNAVVDPNDGSVYVTYQVCDELCADEVWVTMSHDGGLTWTQARVHDGAGQVGNVFSPIAMDTSGNLYVVWSETDPASGRAKAYVSSSTDKGLHWSAPSRVGVGLGNALMPWLVAGDAGRVDVVFYGSDHMGDAATAPAGTAWYVYFAQSLDALNATPEWSWGRTSDVPNHFGSICNDGLDCDVAQPPGDRSLLDFFMVALDPQGRACIIYGDNHLLAPGERPFVTFQRQNGGESVYG